MQGGDLYLKKNILKYLKERWNVYFVSRMRFDDAIEKMEELKGIKPYYMYENEDFTKKFDKKEIERIEEYSAIPIQLIRRQNKAYFGKTILSSKAPSDQYFTHAIKAWHDFYKDKKIDVLVTVFNDQYHSTIGVNVARKMNIPVLFLYGGRLTQTWLIYDSDCRPIFYNRVSKNQIEVFYNKLRDEVLETKLVNEFLASESKKKFGITNEIGKKIKNFLNYANWYYFRIPNFERGGWYSPFDLVYIHLLAAFRKQIIPNFYDKVELNERYILFPLHYIDDSPIRVQEPFIDQYEIIKNISKITPSGWKLYVRPHPHVMGIDTPIKKLREIKKYKNVKVVSTKIDIKELIKNAECVTIINSTVGLEAMVMKKKLITFGHEYIDIIKPTRDFWDISNMRGFCIDKDKDYEPIKEFLANYYVHALRMKSRPTMTTWFYDDEDGKKLADGIIKAYGAIKNSQNSTKKAIFP